jgi:two-component system, NtrC family, nitrogen regulation sensor histidine kinase GlnL
LSGRGEIAAQEMRIGGREHSISADISISSIDDKANLRLISIFPRTGDRGHIAESSDGGKQQAMGAPAILGHEIKNPLAGIRGAAQLIARKSDDDNQPLAELIITEVDRISRLLDQMQNLGGTIPPERSAENIHALIERAIRSVRAANSNIPTITISYDPSLPDIIINSDAMVQILINLLQNALDALEGVEEAHIGINTRYVLAGELREIPISDGRSKSHRLPVEVTISDNGEGVPDHIVDEMFSPFVTTKREGQGLGLAIVRKMVQQMHCRVVYERDTSVGLTAFKLYLPVAK